MAFLVAFGSCLPSHVAGNAEVSALTGVDAAWIERVSGIAERRFACDEETVVSMAVGAARDCLARAGVDATALGLILVSSGTSERRFPGPAAAVAAGLGLTSTPAIDLPLASAGSLAGLALADRLAPAYGKVLIVASEKLSPIFTRPPINQTTAVLFGDGAGACLIDPDQGAARIVASDFHTDGTFAGDLRLEFEGPIEMNGRTVILQATRKLPRAISAVLERSGRTVQDVGAFLLHQANQNLLDRLAAALGVQPALFYSNIRRYGNTSSASLLIAAKEWLDEVGFESGVPVVFAAFGAGFHWGALLAEGV
ncbi:MAG: ketoacyl-ACP synthase III [Bryobacterales bacterium]|nr:ketoacyl-ACP synthase III [Bryobacterales bacterium]